MDESKKIAIHKERNLERTGTYTLYEDRIEVTIKKPFGELLEMSILLKDLSGSTTIHHVRSSIFNAGLWAFVIGGFLMLLPISPKPDFFFFVPIFACTLLAAGYKHMYFVSLLDHSGNPRLTLGVGKTKKEGLNKFLEKMLNAREADSQKSTDGNV